MTEEGNGVAASFPLSVNFGSERRALLGTNWRNLPSREMLGIRFMATTLVIAPWNSPHVCDCSQIAFQAGC